MTNFEKLVAALVAPANDVELAFQQLLLLRSIYTAHNQQLDDIGKIVGQPRGALGDEDYRRYLFARVATNKSAGKRRDFISIAHLILGDAGTAQIVVDNQGAAAVVVRVLNVVPDAGVADILASFLQLAVAAGVRIILETATAPTATSFTLGVTSFASGALTAGDTHVNVDSTAGFPPTGSLDIDVGLAVQETVTYTGTTPTSFTGVSVLAHNHVIDSAVEWNGSPGLGFGLTTFTSGSHSIGATTLNVDDTTGFPSSGSLDIDFGLATAETVTYAGKTGISFTGVSALTQNHVDDSTVQDPGVGGKFADAR